MQQQDAPAEPAQVVDQLAQHAQVLSARLAGIVDSTRQSAAADVTSTLDHLSLYAEAVTKLQVSRQCFDVCACHHSAT